MHRPNAAKRVKNVSDYRKEQSSELRIPRRLKPCLTINLRWSVVLVGFVTRNCADCLPFRLQLPHGTRHYSSIGARISYGLALGQTSIRHFLNFLRTNPPRLAAKARCRHSQVRGFFKVRLNNTPGDIEIKSWGN